MEEGAIAAARFLTVLDLPVGLLGMLVGVVTVVLHPGVNRPDLLASTSLERVAVGLCVAVAALGLFGFGEATVKRGAGLTPLALVFTGMIFLLATPGFLWRTRWRAVGEGIATIGVSVAAILTGFSIGFMFVPLAILMMWICFSAIARDRRERAAGHP